MHNYFVSALYFFGMLLLFVSERLIGSGNLRALSAVGFAFAIGSLLWRLLRARRSETTRQAEKMLALLHSLGIASLLVYFLQSDLSSFLLSSSLEKLAHKFASVLSVLWPIAWFASALPILLVEMSYASIARAPRLESGRLRDALYSGLGLTGALVFTFSLYYVSSQQNIKASFSYFRSSRASESTIKPVQSLTEPVEVSLFFPAGNEVREQVLEYLKEISKASTQLIINEYDRDIDVAKAQSMMVWNNGTLVLGKADRKGTEFMQIPMTLESARTQLASLDKDFYKKLQLVGANHQTIYMVTGHGERGFNKSLDTQQNRAGINDLREYLSQENFELINFGPAEGLTSDVPATAAALLIIGPQKPFMPEEIASIHRYIDRGGRLFIALDPDAKLDFKELLEPLYVSFKPFALTNEKAFAPKANKKSDRINVFTNSFSSHPSVSTLGHTFGASLLVIGAGSFEELPNKPSEVSTSFTVHAPPGTWSDLDGNFEFDPPAEEKKTYEIGVAIKKKSTKEPDKEARIVIFGDSDILSDNIIRLLHNPLLFIDSLKWILSQESLMGSLATASEDAPIVHTKGQDTAWFYSTIFVAPALVIGLGFIATRRKKSQRQQQQKKEAA